MRSLIKIIWIVVFFLVHSLIFPVDRSVAAVNCSDPGVICRNGTISANETWSPGNIYVITGGDLTIPVGAKLTVESGTIVKVDLGREIIVDGILETEGQENNKVYITSLRDDIGGDTNHGTETPAPGDWDRLYFRNGSSGDLLNVVIKYGGVNANAWGAVHTDNASVSFDHSLFQSNQFCPISSNPTYEVSLSNISPNDFTGNTRNGLCLRGGAVTSNATWDETEAAYVLLNDITVNFGITLNWGPGIAIKPLDGVDILVDGILNANGTAISPTTVTSLNDDSIGGDTNNSTTPAAPGQWDRLYFRNGSSGNLSYVVIKFGGEGANAWGALQTDNVDVFIDHGVFTNNEYCPISSNPTYEVSLSNMSPDDFTGNTRNGMCFRGGAVSEDAAWDETEAPYVILNDITVNFGTTLTWGPGIVIKPLDGVELRVEGALNAIGTSDDSIYVTSLHDDSVGGNTNNSTTPAAPGQWDRLYFRDGSSGNLLYIVIKFGGESANAFGALQTDNASVSIDHGGFLSNEYCPIISNPTYEVSLSNMSPSDFIGNTRNGPCLRGGAVSADAVWDETEAAYILLNDITVNFGTTLTWGPGIVIKPLGSSVDIFVEGILTASGTENNPIYLTSIHDDTVGGNTDNAVATKKTGDWGKLLFRKDSSGTLNFVFIQYGSSCIENVDASVTVTNSKLIYCQNGFYSTGVMGNQIINYSDIYGNTNYGVYNGTAGHWIDATHNWWGNASGPYDPSAGGTDGDYNDAGKGDRVSNYVLYRPWTVPPGTTHYLFLPIIENQ